MNKRITVYGVIWGIFFVLFQLAIFLIPGEGRFSAPFWAAYIITTASFIGQGFCAWRVLQTDARDDIFYGMPSLIIGVIGLLILVIINILAVLFPQMPLWLTLLLCFAIAAISAVRILSACLASGMVKERGESVRRSTQSIRRLAAEAEHLMTDAKTPEMRAITKKVYESARFSDTVTHPSLVSQNEQIHTQFAAFRDAVESNDAELASAVAEELLSLLDARKKQARLMK